MGDGWAWSGGEIRWRGGVACLLPDGEEVVALEDFGGIVYMDTTRGFRAAAVDDDEHLRYLIFGPLVREVSWLS